MATDAQIAEPVADGTVLRGVRWKTYLSLRDDPRNYHIRMSYLDGTLILMSPEMLHDQPSRRIAMLIDNVTEALDIPVLGTATTTLRLPGPGPRKGTAKEPDYGFYFREREPLMRTRKKLDLLVDPPPDLAIEIDYKADSAKALKLYARLGVPEVWRYKARKKSLWFGRLSGDGYETIDRSVALPMLTPALVLFALDQVDGMGETPWKRWLRAWAAGLPPIA